MPTSGFSLTVAFRRSGWQWPLDEGDTVRIWAQDGRLAAEIPGPFLQEILRHYLQAAALQGKMGTYVLERERERPMLPPMPEEPTPRLRAAAGRKLRRSP